MRTLYRPRRTVSHDWRKRAVTVALVVVTAVACCGSIAGASGRSGLGKHGLSSADVKALEAALAAARQPTAWTAPGPAFKVGSLKGKTIWLLNDAQNQWADNFADGVRAATKAAGLKYAQGSGGPGGTNDAQAIEAAVNEHVDAIIEIATPTLVASALSKAKAAHIPVILGFDGDAHLPTAQEKALGIVATADYCYSCTGYIAAEYEILAHGGQVHSQVDQFHGQVSSDTIAQGWVKALKHYCPRTCSTSFVNLTLAGNYIQSVQSATQVAAQGGNINSLFSVYDFLMAFQLPELTAAGATNRIDLTSENADLAQMQELAQGGAVKANVGNPVAWDGWAAVDQALRALKGLPPVENEHLPVRLFDSTNMRSVDLTKNPATWYGTTAFASDYEKLWGVGVGG